MNRKATALLAIATVAAGAAFAETPTVDAPFHSTLSTVQVQADLDAFKKAGVNPWAASYNHLRGFKSTATREQVVADFIASRDEVAALNSEDGGSSYHAQGGTRRAFDGMTVAQKRN